MDIAAIITLAFEAGAAIARSIIDAIHAHDGATLRRLADVCPAPLQSRLELEAIKAEALQIAKEGK